MDFIFKTALLVVFALPGLLFNRFWASGPYKGYIAKNNIIEEVGYGLFYALLIHALLLWLFSLIWECFKFSSIINCIIFDSGQSTINYLFTHIWGYLFYFVISIMFSILLGLSFHWLTKITGLETAIKHREVFQRKSSWFYLLRGVEYESRYKGMFVVVAVTVGFNKSDVYLYRGIYEDFDIKRDGSLEKIILTNVSYRKLDQHEENDKRRYDVKSRFFIVHAENIKTISVEYLGFTPTDSDTDLEENFNE